MTNKTEEPKCNCSTTNLLIGLVVVVFLIALFTTMQSAERAADPHICLQIPEAPGCSKVLGLSEHLRGFATPAEAKAGIAQPFLAGSEHLSGDVKRYLAATQNEGLSGDVKRYLAATQNEHLSGDVSKYLAATQNERMRGDVNKYLAATQNEYMRSEVNKYLAATQN